MRQLVAALVAAGLAACNGSHQQAGFQTVRLAIHQDPIAFLPVQVTQTLGYYEEAGLAVEMSEVVGGTILLGSATSAFERRQPRQTFLVDLRTPAGARQMFGSEVFPSLGLLAEERWLRANPDTARRLVRAVTRGMQWVRDHSAEQVREMVLQRRGRQLRWICRRFVSCDASDIDGGRSELRVRDRDESLDQRR
jgi:ABC-type nitrate/sulfonate/bicarbonate transport system substrate-binding protein